MSPATDRLLILGATAYLTERRADAMSDLITARDEQRKLTHAIAAGETVQDEAAALDAAQAAFRSALSKVRLWEGRTPAQLVVAAITDIRTKA